MERYKYYEFSWIEIDGSIILDEGKSYFCTTGPVTNDIWREHVRDTRSKSISAVIAINPGWRELDRKTYIDLGGHAPEE